MPDQWKFSGFGNFLVTLASVVMVVVAAHLVWSVVVVSIIHQYYSHRFPNFGRLPTEKQSWVEFSNAFFHDFVDSVSSSGKSVMFMGSSFTYGYPWQQSVIFSQLIADELKEYRVGNLSVTAAGMQGLVNFALCPETASKIPDILIAEIPLVNSVLATATWPKPDWIEKCHPKASTYEYSPMVFSRPWGVGWLRLLWDDEAYAKPEADLLVPQLPKGYFFSSSDFSQIENKYISHLNIYLDYVSKLGRNVYVYVSPIHTPVIDEAGADRASVEHQISLSYEICRQHGKVICLDASSFNTRRELFYNLTHLNQRGHRAMAQWFEQLIVRQGQGPQLPTLPTPPN